MAQITYKQGMTEVWCDGEKIIITNPTSIKHIEANVDQIFGVGEYQRIFNVKYSLKEEVGFNKLATNIEIVSGYIPDRALQDLDLPENKDIEATYLGLNKKELEHKYFGGAK